MNVVSKKHAEIIEIFGNLVHQVEFNETDRFVKELIYGKTARRNLYKNYNFNPCNLDPVLDWAIKEFLY